MAVDAYLFDWGDTLMVDYPEYEGAMINWPKLTVIDGVKELLETLIESSKVCLATNAQDSNESEIRKVLSKVGLEKYFSHIFCYSNMACKKSDPSYFSKVLSKLELSASSVVMVGDSLEKDILPAGAAGIYGVLYNPVGKEVDSAKYTSVRSMADICRITRQ